MKRCPHCNHIETDDALTFCHADGTPLVGYSQHSGRGARVLGARRLTLSRVRYYIYYRVSEGVLEVLAFWHMSRGREPRL
ncbi:MAG: hypothetical protein LC776_11485 [Acidobacteria bacterium]|nr:hypothetical protein [Acidobacteriota bacterium]